MKSLFAICFLFAVQYTYSQCNCSTTSGWSIVTSTYPVNQTVSCGYEFITHPKDTVNFYTYFNCKPGIVCNSTYRAELKKDGALIRVINPFAFPFVNIFSFTGNYSFTIYPSCEGNACSSICTLYFKVQ